MKNFFWVLPKKLLTTKVREWCAKYWNRIPTLDEFEGSPRVRGRRVRFVSLHEPAYYNEKEEPVPYEETIPIQAQQLSTEGMLTRVTWAVLKAVSLATGILTTGTTMRMIPSSNVKTKSAIMLCSRS